MRRLLKCFSYTGPKHSYNDCDTLSYVHMMFAGLEAEFEKKTLPNGKICVDGFLCVVDVGRMFEDQYAFLSGVLQNLSKTKKPVLIVAAKNDELKDMRQLEKFLTRKECKVCHVIVL